MPALNRVRIYSKTVRQMAQFHSIDAALELFNNEFEGYPPSGAMDQQKPPVPYCGAMKLCEAMMGQDMLGFHTNSVYRRDGMDAAGTEQLYGLDKDDPQYESNLKARKGPFLPLESANAYTTKDIYNDIAQSEPNDFVLCDVYTREMLTGKKTGMPVLYYKANTANNMHYDPDQPTSSTNRPPSEPDNDEGNIYNYFDNLALIEIGKPWITGDVSTTPAKRHSLYDNGEPDRFYKNTRSPKIPTASRPYRADSYILLSAGYDGEYGTADDIFNFEWKYTP